MYTVGCLTWEKEDFWSAGRIYENCLLFVLLLLLVVVVVIVVVVVVVVAEVDCDCGLYSGLFGTFGK